MRNVLFVVLAFVATGCVDIDITTPQVEEERVADTMPVIVLSPATTPITWVHSGEYTKNTVTFFAPADAHLLNFDVISDTPEVVSITNQKLKRYDDPYCGVQCSVATYVLEIYMVTGRFGQAKISYTLQSDRRVTGHFTVIVDPRG